MIGTDSHIPNVGGVSMLGFGVGGADAVDAMAGLGVELQTPRIYGIQLTGRLTFPATPKDVILTLAGLLSTRGAIGAVLEYFGDGVDSISATGSATISNMGAELGASTSIFPYDHHTTQYLRSTGRKQVAQECDANRDLLQADPAVEKSPMEFYEKIVHLDLTSVKPCVNGPFSPDLCRPLGDLAMEARAKGWPETIEAALIGSCTNSSFEDFSKVALLARAAHEVGLVCQVPLYLSPGSQTVQKLLEENGLLNDLKNLGATLLANACGPRAGQWNRNTIEKNKPNSIFTSFNRNFRARNDANPNTHAFLASPESVLCFALAGNLDCSKIWQKLSLSKRYRNLCDATNVLPHPEIENMAFPEHKNTVPNEQVEIKIAPASRRLQLLDAFSPPKLDSDFSFLKLLIKVSGKCTTDHICMAGPWLRFRGHLENISDNLLIGAINSHNSEVNKVQNALTGDWMTVPKYARDLKSRGLGWIVVAEHNYGEGSSREHAALVPRHLGCKAIVCMSFARIHEANLKKQGILPLTFEQERDYDLIRADDSITLDLKNLAPMSQVLMLATHSDNTSDSIKLNHSLTASQIQWFHSGSSLNFLSKTNYETRKSRENK